MNIPSEKNFALSKVKCIKDGGLDVHFEVTETIGEEVYTEKYHMESAKDIHPDLRKCFKDLRPIMARIFNLTSFLTLIATPEFAANETQQKAGDDFAKELMEKIEVRGISLSGKDDNVGVVLTGLFTVINNQKTAINSPRLKFSNVVYGFEEELEEIIAEIEKEVYAFLFLGKKAELELFNAAGGPSQSMTTGPTKPRNGGKDKKGKTEGEAGPGLFPEVTDPAKEQADDQEGGPDDETDDETERF